MSDRDKKKDKRSDVGVLAERAASAQLSDKSSDALRRKAKSVGNEEMKQRIESGQANRDELLDFICDRLRTIRDVQNDEVDLSSVKVQRRWWKLVSDIHKPDYTKPNPRQWIEVARVYEEASYQLSRGALGRGKQLIERAIDKEKKTMDGLTKLVKVKDEEKNPEMPEAAGPIAPDDTCPSKDVPQEIRTLVHEIEQVTVVAQDPPGRKRKRDPWWTLWEEEEEEEEGFPTGSP